MKPVGNQSLLKIPGFDKIPVKRIIERPQFIQRARQKCVLFQNVLLRGNNAFPGPDPRLELDSMERLGQKIIRPAFKTFDKNLAFGLCGQQNEIPRTITTMRAIGPAKLDPRHAGHHPVADDQLDIAGPAKIKRLFA